MKNEPKPFVIAEHLTNEETIESFLVAAREENDPLFLIHAEKIVEKARELNAAKED